MYLLAGPLIVRVDEQVVPLRDHESTGGEPFTRHLDGDGRLLALGVLGAASKERADYKLVEALLVAR